MYLACILIYLGENKAVVIQEVESSGTAQLIDIQHTAAVKAGDRVTAIGSSHTSLAYLALPGVSVFDAAMASEKVQQAVGNIRLQLERPLEQVFVFPKTFLCELLYVS